MDKLTLKDTSSTPKQCVQFVNVVQKNHRDSAGREIFNMSIYGFTGLDTWRKLESIVRNNGESEWLKSAKREYEDVEYYLKEALKNFKQDNAPVLDALDAMIEWFMEFFTHRRSERWQMEDEVLEFWREYFDILKNI